MEKENKPVEELVFPDDLYYHPEHAWARVEGDRVTVGISDFAQDRLGEILFIETPEAGDAFDKGEEFGQAESTKVVSPLYMPVSGEVTEVNERIEDDPAIVNRDVYGEGWLIRVKPGNMSEVKSLMSAPQYANMLRES